MPSYIFLVFRFVDAETRRVQSVLQSMKNFHPIGSKILANNGVNFSSKDFPKNKVGMDRVAENMILDFRPDIRWVPDTGCFRHMINYSKNLSKGSILI